MSLVRMARLSALVFDRHAPLALAELAKLGAVEILPTQACSGWPGGGTSPAENGAALQKASSLAKRARELGRSLGIEADPEGPLVPVTEAVDLDRCSADLAEAEKALAAVEARLAEVDRRLENLGSVKQKLSALRGMAVDVALLRSLSFVEITHARVPAENYARLEKTLDPHPVVLLPLGTEDPGRRVLLLAYPRSIASAVDAALTTLLAERDKLPEGISGEPDAALTQIEDAILAAELEKRKIVLEREAVALAQRRRLPDLIASLLMTRLVTDLDRLSGASGRARIISAWIPAASRAAVEDALDRATAGSAIVRITEVGPGEGEPGAGAEQEHGAEGGAREHAHAPAPPTLLRNPALLGPFEALVNMYGRPAYGEMDPTPILGVSFVVMFGMMFGDLGQGAVLFLTAAIVSWITGRRAKAARAAALAAGRKPAQAKPSAIGQAMTIMLLCSSSSMFFGCMYGDFFGYHMGRPLWLKPMEETMHFLMVTAVFGVVFMTIGLAMSLINTARNREWGELLFGKNGLAGIFFYWGTLSLFVVLGVKITVPLAILVWVVPSVLMFLREPLTHAMQRRKRLLAGGVGEYLVGAFFELFETVIGYLSNTISFVRLAAFALNHAGLFTVVFLLAKMANAGPADGWVDAAIIVLGNVFIIGLEGLVVTIQALRLEYYEFFSKFYRGTGTPFKPVKVWEQES